MTTHPIWYISFDAVVYPLSQVTHGKTLLVDLPSQYGLFPEIIAPFFRIINFSIYSFTVFCSILQIISLTSLYYVIHQIVRDRLLKLALGFALLMITFETVLFIINVPDRYFQYWPIRFFWPALSVLTFFKYSIRPTVGKAALFSLLGAIGAIWNADSGLVIEAAFAAFLVAKWISMYWRARATTKPERRILGVALLVHVACFVLALLLMKWYLVAKSGGHLHTAWLTEYQKIFYGLGFMMLPMPLTPSPWMSVLAIYLMGIIVSVSSWTKFPSSRRSDLIFYLSLLGLGLFIYYEGRSHVLNLISVCWPALMLVAILADRTLRAVNAKLGSSMNVALYIAALAILAFCSEPLLASSGRMMSSALNRYEHRHNVDDQLVARELSFIRKHSRADEECLIFSRRQGIYYAETGLSSPIRGPGITEMILQRDLDDFVASIKSTQIGCVFMGIGKESAINVGVDNLKLFQGYHVVATSLGGSMVLMVPSGH